MLRDNSSSSDKNNESNTKTLRVRNVPEKRACPSGPVEPGTASGTDYSRLSKDGGGVIARNDNGICKKS